MYGLRRAKQNTFFCVTTCFVVDERRKFALHNRERTEGSRYNNCVRARAYTEVCATCRHPSPPQGALRAGAAYGGEVFKTSRSTRHVRAQHKKPSATVTAKRIAHKCFALLNLYRHQISVHAHVPKFLHADELLPLNENLLSPLSICVFTLL